MCAKLEETHRLIKISLMKLDRLRTTHISNNLCKNLLLHTVFNKIYSSCVSVYDRSRTANRTSSLAPLKTTPTNVDPYRNYNCDSRSPNLDSGNRNTNSAICCKKKMSTSGSGDQHWRKRRSPESYSDDEEGKTRKRKKNKSVGGMPVQEDEDLCRNTGSDDEDSLSSYEVFVSDAESGFIDNDSCVNSDNEDIPQNNIPKLQESQRNMDMETAYNKDPKQASNDGCDPQVPVASKKADRKNVSPAFPLVDDVIATLDNLSLQYACAIDPGCSSSSLRAHHTESPAPNQAAQYCNPWAVSDSPVSHVQQMVKQEPVPQEEETEKPRNKRPSPPSDSDDSPSIKRRPSRKKH